MRRPLMMMRKKSLLGSMFGKYAGLNRSLGKSVGDFISGSSPAAPAHDGGLYTSPNDITHADWEKTNGSATDFETFNEGTGSSERYLHQSRASNPGQYTITFECKYVDLQYVGTRANLVVGGWTNVKFDIQNGTILSDGGANVDDAVITDMGSGWYKIQITLTDSQWDFPRLYIFNSSGSSGAYSGTSRTVKIRNANYKAGGI